MSKKVNGESRSTGLSGLLVAVVIFKIMCMGIMVVIILIAGSQLSEFRVKQAEAQSWSKTNDYAVFYPHMIGYDTYEGQKRPAFPQNKINEATTLYEELNRRGSIFIDAEPYEEASLNKHIEGLPTPPIKVNVNYLNQYPVYDVSGSPVNIGEDDYSWIVLIPDKYKSQETSIRQTIKTRRENLMSSEKSITGRDPSIQVQQVNIRIVWIRSNQKIFSFDTTVNSSDNNMITDPIIEVMTNNNSLTWDRLNSINGDIDTRLKVKLVNGSVQDTMRDLHPLLKQLQLDDNLPYLVRVSDAKLQESYDLQRAATSLGIASIVMLLVALLLEIVIVSISYACYAKRCVVRRLLGYGKMASQHESIRMIIISWIMQSALGIVLAFSFSKFAGQELLPRFSVPLIGILFAVGIVEFLVMFAAMSLVESRSMVRQLKEF